MISSCDKEEPIIVGTKATDVLCVGDGEVAGALTLMDSLGGFLKLKMLDSSDDSLFKIGEAGTSLGT